MKQLTLSLLLVLLLTNCSELLITPESDESIKYEQFNAVWNLVDREYPFLEFKGIDWDAMYDKYEARITATTGDEYLGELVNLLGELKDGHVGFELKSGFARTYYTPREVRDRLSYSPEVVRSYFEDELKLVGDGRINYGILDETIGYIRIQTWDEGNLVWIRDLDTALEDLKDTEGLIIDVRHNGGGCSCIRDRATSRFLNDTLQAPGSIRNGEFIEGITLIPYTPVPYENNIVVLINGVSFSATEIFARDMKTIDRVTVVGDTTGGGGAAVQFYDLPHAAKVKLTYQNFLRYDLEPIEWNGIAPDVLVQQSEEDIKNGRDKQLEFSIDYLKK